jgi:phosphatidylglycerol---prolipoprotein diacylglyceryl transferase
VRWHFLFESLAYAIAFRIYLHQRKQQGDFLDTSTRWSVVAAAFVGAVLGSKLLNLAENPAETMRRWHDLAYLFGGKTIVGALAGGTIAVELTKLRIGVTRRTGDLFAIPLAIGIAIGRIGCLLAGVADDTYGLPTSLPWGIDLGDGVRRHPVQLYESVAMLALAYALSKISPPSGAPTSSAPTRFTEGDRFRVFMLSYFAWRVVIDFLKPGVPFAGLTALQWTAAAGFLFYTPDLVRILTNTRAHAKPKELPVHG